MPGFSTLEVDPRESEVKGDPWLCGEFEARVGYTK